MNYIFTVWIMYCIFTTYSGLQIESFLKFFAIVLGMQAFIQLTYHLAFHNLERGEVEAPDQ